MEEKTAKLKDAGMQIRFLRAIVVLCVSICAVLCSTGVVLAHAEDISEEIPGIAQEKGDGTYYGSAEGYQSTITVAVTVNDGAITRISLVSHADDQTYVDFAERVIDRIIAAQSVDVDTVSGATYSSRGIIEATRDAISGSGSASIASASWFGYLAILLALILGLAAVYCVRLWHRASTRRERESASNRQRLLLQLMFFILAPSSFASGFMGIKSLLMQIHVMQTQRGYDFQIALFTVLLIGLLVATVLFGRFFCGYICSFGLLGDLVFRAGEAVRRKLGLKALVIPSKVETVLRGLKYLVLVAVCVVVYLGFSNLLNDISPWTAFSSLSNASIRRITAIGAVLLLIVVIGSLLKERFFCEFLCPLGAIFSLVPVLPSGKMRRQRPKCLRGCSACKDSCPVNIEPKGKPIAGECLMCGRCAEVCPRNNVVRGVEVREDQKSSDAHGIRKAWQLVSSRPVAVIIIAVVMLAMLWLMHATRFLPVLFA